MAQALPDQSRAAVLVEYGQPLEIRALPVPRELERGALLVRTTAATVCATDLHFAAAPIAGGYAAGRLPVVLGHEMTGTVAAIAEGAELDSLGRPLAIGDRIVWSHGYCGHCEACVVRHQPTLCENLRGYMRGCAEDYPYLTGGFSEYVYVFPTSGRIRVPDGLSDAVVAASSCALRTLVQGFDRLGGVTDEQTVVILGTGPLGLFAVALASVAGSGQLLAVGGPQLRLDLATRWGATNTVDVAATTGPERVEAVLAATGGRGADVVIEVSGVPSAFGEGMTMLRRGGRYLVIGQLHAEQVPFNPSQIVTKQAHLIGSVSADIGHYHRGLNFLLRHGDRFTWSDMISETHPLDGVNDAMAAMRSWSAIKPALLFPDARV